MDEAQRSNEPSDARERKRPESPAPREVRPTESAPLRPAELSPDDQRGASTPGSGENPGTVLDLRRLHQLGPYRVLRMVRAGGMGVVYEAWHDRLQRRVALKTLRPDWMQDSLMVARFQREMAAVGRLDHPNIVRASDAGEHGGCPFLVMDFIDGVDLAEVVRRCGPLPVPDACEVARQTALGLQYAHEHGLVHRDLKPSNLMLTADGQVKVLDLGLALVYDSAGAGRVTEAGQRMGTLDYMAPEQAEDAHRVDIRADLYSLGCTLYELVSGQAPFGGPEYGSPTKKLRAHAETPAPPLRLHRPAAPAELADLLARLLAKDPVDRPECPRDVVVLLEPLAAGCDLAALAGRAGAPPSKPASAVAPPLLPETPSAPERPAQAPRQHRFSTARLVLASALLLGVLLAGGLLLAWRQRQPSDGGPAEQEPARLVWPADYPRSLRQRPWQQPVALLEPRPEPPAGAEDLSGALGSKADPASRRELLFRPVWCRRLFGTGEYYPSSVEMQLWSRTNKRPAICTLLALDDDLRRRWFEFTAELPEYINDQFRNPRGVFFGWQKDGPARARAYFVQLDLRPAPGDGRPHGQLVVGPALLDLRPQAAAQVTVAPLAPFAGTPPRSRSLTAATRRHLVRVRAVPGKVSVQINAEPPLEFEPPFDPRGPLGIWVQDGGGRFRTATVTAVYVP